MTDVATQRRDALAKANGVRSRRARLKRLIKDGELTLAEALDDPAAFGRTPAVEFLMLKRSVGRHRATAFLRRTFGPGALWLERVPLRSMPVRERRTLREALERRGV